MKSFLFASSSARNITHSFSRLSGAGRLIAMFSVMVFLSGYAHANLVSNGGFEITTGNSSSFVMSNGTGGPYAPDNWTFSGGIGCVTFSASTSSQSNACGSNFASLYPGWTFSSNGGNFVLMDGDPTYHGTLSQSVSVVQGHSYEISFEQAASQFQFYSGATTEQWQVCLGGQCQLSALMNNASKGFVPWENQTLTFTASTTGSELVSFMSVGTPNGLPPVVLLDGISMEEVPEPSAILLTAGGLVMLGSNLWRRHCMPTKAGSKE